MDASTLLTNLKVKDLDAGEVFSNKPSGTVVKGYEQPCAYTPPIDPEYVFQESSRPVKVTSPSPLPTAWCSLLRWPSSHRRPSLIPKR